MISVIDDDEPTRRALVDLMRAKGFNANCYASAEDFLRADARRYSRCIITDIQMPGLSGIDLKRRLNAEAVRTPVIMITARLERRFKQEAANCGAFCFLAKPFAISDLFDCVNRALATGEGAW
jgi:FixJ family two-component response regulator